MHIPEQFRLKNTIKYPTSIIVGGMSALGFELADALIEQGGYVILVDTFTQENVEKLKAFPKDTLISFVDYASVPHLPEDIRRLDYVFYFNHEAVNFTDSITTQEFLQASNTLDSVLSLAQQFEAKFLLTTAIKAQQLLLSAEDLHLRASSKSHSVAYSQMELQRYAENLVQEYHEKTDLDTRIIRLGELIGEHADFTSHTRFNELIISAARSQALRLYKDGLESEWFVHTLDASYGIIKAQFTNGTTGKIFSLAYENPITHLSIAYKIQEVVDYMPEIVFVDEKDNLPKLALYKPAPNLQTIGWKPKISFEQAVKQTYLAAKVFDTHGTTKQDGKGASIVARLQSIVGGKDEEPEQNALSRLISERNKQEEIKRRRMELAHSTTKRKRSYKPRTFEERVQNALWKQYLAFASIFTFFKNRSPAEALGFFLIFLLCVGLYIFLVAPILLITRDGYSLHRSYNDIQENIENNEWNEAQQNSQNIVSTLESLDETLEFISPALQVVALDDDVAEIQTSIAVYSQYAQGAEEIFYYLQPLDEYRDEYQGNTQLRLNSEEYISLLNEGVNNQDILLELEARQPFVEAGVQKIELAGNSLPTSQSDLLPPYLRSKIESFEFELLTLQAELETYEQYQFLPELMGSVSPTTLAVVTVDNSVPRSIGGELATVTLVTVQNGSINQLQIFTPQSYDVDSENISSQTIEAINQYRFTPLTTEGFSLESLATIGAVEQFDFELRSILNAEFDIEIDGTVILTLEDMAQLMNFIEAQTAYTFTVNGVETSSADILSSINQNANSLQEKNNAVAQLQAQLIHQVSENYSQLFPQFVTEISARFTTGSALAYLPELEIQTLVNDVRATGDRNLTTNQFFSIYTNTVDTTRVGEDAFNSFTYDLQYIVSNNYNTSFDVRLQPQFDFASQDIILCVPGVSVAQTFEVEVSSGQNARNDFIDGQQCSIINTTNTQPIQAQWNITIADESQQNIDYSLLLPAVYGYQTNIDAEFIFGDQFERVTVTPGLVEGQDSFIFTDSIVRDSLYQFRLEK